MAIEGVYLVESEVVWDHSSRVFATITLEKPHRGLDQIADPGYPDYSREADLCILRPITKAQDVTGKGTSRLIALYRVMSDSPTPQIYQGSQNVKFCFVVTDLKLICTFDSDGNPVKP